MKRKNETLNDILYVLMILFIIWFVISGVMNVVTFFIRDSCKEPEFLDNIFFIMPCIFFDKFNPDEDICLEEVKCEDLNKNIPAGLEECKGHDSFDGARCMEKMRERYNFEKKCVEKGLWNKSICLDWRPKTKCELNPEAEGCICDELDFPVIMNSSKYGVIRTMECLKAHEANECELNNPDYIWDYDNSIDVYGICLSDDGICLDQTGIGTNESACRKCAEKVRKICRKKTCESKTICLNYLESNYWNDDFMSFEELEYIKESLDCEDIKVDIVREGEEYLYKFYGNCPLSDYMSKDKEWIKSSCDSTIIKEVCE